MYPYFNAVRVLRAVAVERDKELRSAEICFSAPPREGYERIIFARHADLYSARFQFLFDRQRKLEIIVLFEPALIFRARIVTAVTGVEANVNAHTV